MLVIDVLWRQSMLQTNGCGRKSIAYSQLILLESLVSDV